MNRQLANTLASILLALTVAVATTAAEAGNGGVSRGGDDESGNGAAYGPGQTTEQGYDMRNSNPYRHQHQYRHGSENGNIPTVDSGKGQYSNDRYLNQKDYQAWLYQNQNQLENSNQERYYPDSNP